MLLGCLVITASNAEYKEDPMGKVKTYFALIYINYDCNKLMSTDCGEEWRSFISWTALLWKDKRMLAETVNHSSDNKVGW